MSAEPHKDTDLFESAQVRQLREDLALA
ncbi:MAG: hypothetical protein RLZ51_1588, partial [Pseudomonadota bacterium]